MSGTLSTRWFWSDWMSDPSLRACSYAARGLWHDMLCIAGSNKQEHGFVSLNGKKLDGPAIARMTNGTTEEVVVLLAELETNGVFSRDRRGAIYCRRMVRAEKSRTNGRLGGNPNLLKNKENKKQVGEGSKAHIPKPLPEPRKTQTPARKAPVRASEWPVDYQTQFWDRYPRKTEKKAAMAKLDAIRKSGTVAWLILMAGVNRYRLYVEGSEERYIKHPTTWLNRGCWDDQHAGRRAADGERRGGGLADLSFDLMNYNNQEQQDGADASSEDRSRTLSAALRTGVVEVSSGGRNDGPRR